MRPIFIIHPLTQSLTPSSRTMMLGVTANINATARQLLLLLAIILAADNAEGLRLQQNVGLKSMAGGSATRKSTSGISLGNGGGGNNSGSNGSSTGGNNGGKHGASNGSGASASRTSSTMSSININSAYGNGNDKEEFNIGLIAPHTNFGKRDYLRAINMAIQTLNKMRGTKWTFLDDYAFSSANVHFDMMSLTPSPTSE